MILNICSFFIFKLSNHAFTTLCHILETGAMSISRNVSWAHRPQWPNLSGLQVAQTWSNRLKVRGAGIQVAHALGRKNRLFIGGPARTVVLQLTLSKSVIQYLLALGCFEGHLTCICSLELFVGHWKEVAVVFCIFFRLDMLTYAGVMTK